MLKRLLRQALPEPLAPAAPPLRASPDAWWLWLSAMSGAGNADPAPGALRRSRP